MPMMPPSTPPAMVAAMPPAEVPNGSSKETFLRELEQWRKTRDANLRRENGWLTLVGLDWLSEGENSFGSDPSNAVPLPGGKAPAKAGVLLLDHGIVRVKAAPEANLTLNGKPVSEQVLKSDAEGAPDILSLGHLSFYVIKRGDRFGIRVKDSESPVRLNFKGIASFPADHAYQVVADFVPYATPKEVHIPTVLGTEDIMLAPGFVRFKLLGKVLTLEPVIEDPKAPELFFIFRDKTSGKTTYPAGRFLYAAMPKDGKVVLDFNRSYNPPCAFTPFATCPLPPPQNRLPIAVKAGEKTYGHH
ncbi:MAG: DUF1684 domain-containing protein [Acidobacteriota bacterium]|nr:DUF1684 domain-containing protein [Acidobacteriota bacterium]